jgi:hypothetical protein
MQKIIIDTDIAIDYLRGLEYAKKFINGLWGSDAAYLSILSVYELYAGMKEKEREDTDNFIKAFNIEFIDYAIARKGTELFKKYRKTGISLTTVDCLIAASAIVKKYKIATRNIKHYPEKDIIYRLF